MTPNWFLNWTGQPCVIVASGPSALEQPIYEARWGALEAYQKISLADWLSNPQI